LKLQTGKLDAKLDTHIEHADIRLVAVENDILRIESETLPNAKKDIERVEQIVQRIDKQTTREMERIKEQESRARPK